MQNILLRKKKPCTHVKDSTSLEQASLCIAPFNVFLRNYTYSIHFLYLQIYCEGDFNFRDSSRLLSVGETYPF